MTERPASPTLAGALFALGAMFAVGSSVAAADVIKGYPVLGGQAVRYAIAAALLVALGLRTGRLPRPSAGEAVRASALALTGLVLFNVTLIAAVKEADAGTVGAIIGCTPVVLALAGPVAERRRPSAAIALAALVVTAGAVTVEYNGGGISLLGLALSLATLGGEVAFSLIAVPLLPRLGPLGVSAYACVAAVPLCLAGGLLADGGGLLAAPSGDELLALGWMACFVTTFGFLCWYSALDRLGVERAGLFTGLIPVFALLCAALVAGSELTAARLGGAVVVGAGVVLGVRAGSGPERAQPPHA